MEVREREREKSPMQESQDHMGLKDLASTCQVQHISLKLGIPLGAHHFLTITLECHSLSRINGSLQCD